MSGCIFPLCVIVIFVLAVARASTMSNTNRFKVGHSDVVSSSSQLMKFGNTFPISVKLPTPEISIARKYLSNPSHLVESTWPEGNYKRLEQDGAYRLQMGSFYLPGVQNVLPEIETKFEVHPESGMITMKSGEWTIMGSGGGILKDSKFMNSFDIVSFLWLICLDIFIYFNYPFSIFLCIVN